MKRDTCITIAALALFYCASYAFAGEGEEDDFRNEIDSYIRYAPFSSADNMSGKITTLETGFEYSYELKVFNKLPVTFSLSNDCIFIDSNVPISLPSRLVGVTTDIETILPISGIKGAYIGAGISPSFYSDDWSFEASAFRLPSRGFVAYRPDEKWTFVGGVAVYPRFKDPVWPIFGLIYKPTKKLAFNLVSDNPNIVYSLNDSMSVFVEGDFSYNEFEVSRDDVKDVILRYEDARAGVGVEFKFNKFTRALLLAGGVFDRSLKYRDGGGKVNINPGFYTGLKLLSEF